MWYHAARPVKVPRQTLEAPNGVQVLDHQLILNNGTQIYAATPGIPAGQPPTYNAQFVTTLPSGVVVSAAGGEGKAVEYAMPTTAMGTPNDPQNPNVNYSPALGMHQSCDYL